AAALVVPARAGDALADEVLLKEAGVSTDGVGLLAFFRARAAAVAAPERIDALVAQLSDAHPQEREPARRGAGGRGPPDAPPHPARTESLAHPLPVRRAAAGDALCAGGLAEPRDRLLGLLSDPKPSVRLRAALALAGAREPRAVEVLIGTLADLTPEQARQA